MNNEQLLKILMELGLSENEALVYLATLSLGNTSVSKIASVTGIKRTSVYPVITKLQKFGLVSQIIIGFKTFYSAESPGKLEVLLEERKTKFNKFLPDFSKLYNLEGKADVIKRYQGMQAIKSIYEDLLLKIKPHEDYLIITDQEKWLNLDEEFFAKFVKNRAKLPINTRVLMVDNATGQYWKKYEQNFNMKIKLLPKDVSEMPTNVVITPQTLVVHQINPPVMALVIENKSTIAFQKQMFEIVWRALKED